MNRFLKGFSKGEALQGCKASPCSRKCAFTLIELLVVIAVVGIVSAAIFAAINVTGNLGKAKLANAETFDASVQNSLSIDLVGEWTFNEGIQGSAKDTSGYGNNGTVNGTTLTTDRKGNNKAYSFGGADNVNVGDPASGIFVLA